MADNIPWTTRRLSPDQIAGLSDEEKAEGYKALKAAYEQAKNAGAAGAVDLGKLSSNLQNIGAKLGNKGWTHPKYEVVSAQVVEEPGKKPLISVTKKDEDMPLPATVTNVPVPPTPVPTQALSRLPLGVSKNRQVQAPAPIQLTDVVTTAPVVEDKKAATVPDAGAYSWLADGMIASDSSEGDAFASEEEAQAEMIRRQQEQSQLAALEARADEVQRASDLEMLKRQEKVRSNEAERIASLVRKATVDDKTPPKSDLKAFEKDQRNIQKELEKGSSKSEVSGEVVDYTEGTLFDPRLASLKMDRKTLTGTNLPSATRDDGPVDLSKWFEGESTDSPEAPLPGRSRPATELARKVISSVGDVGVVSPSRTIAAPKKPTVTLMGQPLPEGEEGPIEPPRTIETGPEKTLRAQLPGGFLVDGVDVEARPVDERFITYSPKPTDSRTPEQKNKQALLKNQLAMALETFGRRSAGLNLQQMPELTTPKFYQMEQDTLNRDLAREKLQYDRTQQAIDRGITGENRLFQRTEQLRDNIRAVDRQMTDLSVQEAQLNVQENDVRERLSKAGYGTAYIEGQVTRSFGMARKALNDQKNVLKRLRSQYENVFNQLSAAQTTPIPSFAGGVPAQVGGPLPEGVTPSSPVSPQMPPAQGGTAPSRPSGGSSAPSFSDERTRINTVDIGDGRKVIIKPQFSTDLKDLQKQALTFKQSLEATKGIESQLSNLFKIVENPNSSMEDVNRALSAIRASVGNASGKALAAEGLSSTVEALRGVEHALSPGVASTWGNALAASFADKTGIGKDAAKSAFNTWKSGVQASVSAYKKAVEHARDTWAEQYGDAVAPPSTAQEGATKKVGSKTFVFKNGSWRPQ